MAGNYQVNASLFYVSDLSKAISSNHGLVSPKLETMPI
jgi:hypothetical protein